MRYKERKIVLFYIFSYEFKAINFFSKQIFLNFRLFKCFNEPFFLV